MHCIVAGTMSQALQFAAALKMSQREWAYVSEPSEFRRIEPSAIYVLPGASAYVAGGAEGYANLNATPIHHLP